MESRESKKDTISDGRRVLLKGAAAIPLAAVVPRAHSEDHTGRSFLKTSCNVYSFNGPLRSGQMTLEQVLEFCADVRFDAIDPTGYYFPNYPDLPDDSYVYKIKRKAFRLGLDISGTGVRNDFTLADAGQRKGEVELVKRWVGLAARLGAPCLRVFSGRGHSVWQDTR